MSLMNALKVIKDTVKKQISKEFLAAAKKGEFLIPQSYLEAALRHALKNEAGVEVETVNFHAQGITIKSVRHVPGGLMLKLEQSFF
jgi:hypothetical protein